MPICELMACKTQTISQVYPQFPIMHFTPDATDPQSMATAAQEDIELSQGRRRITLTEHLLCLALSSQLTHARAHGCRLPLAPGEASPRAW